MIFLALLVSRLLLIRTGCRVGNVMELIHFTPFFLLLGWFAHRADIVLVFFDPDKPGTTGETMSVLLNSLSGMDHKLLIILNKADQFEKIHDFARAYGSRKSFSVFLILAAKHVLRKP